MKAVGLYDPKFEHDACGVAFVARLDGTPSHETLRRALKALANLEHRGAAGADASTGDGAGILVQLPDAFFREVLHADLPAAGRYGVAVCFLPHEPARRAALEHLLEAAVAEEGQSVVGWRDVPVDARHVGATAGGVAPLIRQLFVAASPGLDEDAFERKLYVIRRRAELAAGPELVVPSFSARRVVYKGMLTAPQLLGYYPDLQDERAKTALALVHSRFSYASGTIIISACGSERPASTSSSSTLSKFAVSEPPGRTTGSTLARSSPKRSDASCDSRARIQLMFPRTVLISPLWAIMR